MNRGNYKFAIYDETADISSMQGTYGVASADLDNDGLQELTLANIGSRDNAQIFQNKLTPGYWIGFQLEGVESNWSAIGTRIEVLDNRGCLHVDQVTAGNGYAGQNTKRIHFGFGNVGAIKSIKIIWPNGLVQEMEGMPLGNYYYVKEGNVPEILGQEQMTTSTEDLLTDTFQLSVYPNPTSRFLQIETNDLNPFHLQLININGQIIQEQHIQNSQTTSIDLQDNTGILLLKITQNGREVSKKILVR